MNPNLQIILNDKKIRYVITGFGLLFVFILILWAVITILKPATLHVTPTNISTLGGVTVSDNKIISYNGSSFIEISPDEESAKVIYTPQTNFPYVKEMTYAPGKGVLLTFSKNVEQTPVSDYKIDHSDDTSLDSVTNDDEDTEHNYTWYLDFKTNKLIHISDNDIAEKLTLYSSVDQTFYFIDTDSTNSYTNLKAYDTKKDQLSTVVTKLQLSNPTHLNRCGDAFCITGQDKNTNDTSSLLKVTPNGQISTLEQVKGAILPTPDPSTYAFLTDKSDVADDENDDTEGDTATYQTLSLINIETKESKEYSGFYQSSGWVGRYNNHFYFAGATDANYQYLKLSKHDMKFDYDKDEYYLDDGLTPISTPGESFSLISDNENIYIVSTKSNFNVLQQANADEVSKRLDNCAAKVDSIKIHGADEVSSEFNVDFEITVPDDQDFDENIWTMNKCIAKDIDNLVGYSYVYTPDRFDENNY